MIKRVLLTIVVAFFALICFQYFYGGSPNLISNDSKDFEVLAHRGVHVNWKKGTYHPITGCEATHIYEPTHTYVENTIESIGAAFDLGATMVEIDIRRTLDNHLVVFHDDNLDCRTNGSGKVVDSPLEYLKTLDIGYGYTPNNGEMYPLRGKGIGKIPTLEEVLNRFPQKKFLIDGKDGSMETVEGLELLRRCHCSNKIAALLGTRQSLRIHPTRIAAPKTFAGKSLRQKAGLQNISSH